MIKLEFYEAKTNVNAGKNGTFLQGEIYIGRMSKDGSCYVVKSEEGYWIPLIFFKQAKVKSYEKNFEFAFKKRWKPFYVKKYKELNECD